jgi:hypothetical protein
VASVIAFDVLDRARDDFALAPVHEAFNWPAFAELTDLETCYMVAFRSVRNPGADVALLDALDEVAHQDASTQPGFLFYFKGKILPGADHLGNLSFCLWRSQADAKASARRPAHREASAVALTMYQRYELECFEVRVLRAGGRARVEFGPV